MQAQRLGTLAFARHEARLMWRDWSAMMTAGRTYRGPLVAGVLAGVYAGLHWLADGMLSPSLADGLAPTASTWLVVSGLLAMMFALMASQAIESVTRVYFGRSDLDLILSSPAPVAQVFVTRAGVIALQTAALSLLIASPVINMAAWRLGPQLLLSYGVVASLGFLAAALALAVSLFLMRTLGPKKARLIAQVVAAFVGAGFVIALQAFAITSGAGLDRMAFFTAPDVLTAAPGPDSPLWLVAKAALGDPKGACALAAICLALFALATVTGAKSFERDAIEAASLGRADAGRSKFRGFSRSGALGAALRSKEWRLLRRDPWLLSQSLQQVLYMLPPALLLFFSFGEDRSVLFVIVPVLVMATGQLAGGLAWLAISGEDAHELIATAPVTATQVLVAKVQAVAGVVAWLVVPLSLALLPLSPKAALCTLLGAGGAAASATVIQLWFRAQASRSFFRRRQVSSRAATICEAMVSINCAALACLVMAEAPAVVLLGPCLALVLTFGVARLLRPAANG